MELKYKLSDYYEPLSQTEITKMPKKQMEVIQFIDKIDNVKLTIRQVFHNARVMLAIPLAIALFSASIYTINYIYIDPWKKTEISFIERLKNKNEIKEGFFYFEKNTKRTKYEEIYIKDGRLAFSDYWNYYYYNNSFISEPPMILEFSAIFIPFLFSILMFYWGVILKNRPPLICDRKKQLFYTWDMKMNVYVAKYSQIEFADIRPTFALFLYRVDNHGKLIEHKYYPNLTLFSYLGGGSDNDKAWGLGYITKYFFNGLSPLAESNYTRKRLRIFRDAPIPQDLEQQIQDQVSKVDIVLPPNEEIEARLAESIKRSS